jgi:site-specific recombinase XerD
MELGPCEDLRIFPYKCDIRNKPFLVNRDGKPLPYSRFWYNLKELSFRAGYIEWVRPYDIRRGTGTKLDGELRGPNYH